MITRIVKLTIEPKKSNDFIIFFEQNKQTIKTVNGCHDVSLLQDVKFPNIFFTYSYWENEESLNKYRESDLFKIIWSFASSCFCDRPQAWTLIKK